jgi:hypothetical protein
LSEPSAGFSASLAGFSEPFRCFFERLAGFSAWLAKTYELSLLLAVFDKSALF